MQARRIANFRPIAHIPDMATGIWSLNGLLSLPVTIGNKYALVSGHVFDQHIVE